MRRQILRTLTVSALLLVGGLGVATAGRGAEAGPSAALGQYRTATASLLQTPLLPKSTCYGRTDNPHRSKHRPGYITVQGRTVCPGEVGVRVVLLRRRFGIWRQVGHSSRSGFGLVRANASRRARCGLFKGVSYHTASNHYPAVTANRNRIPCG
jgi:hypothetical protein